MNYNKHALIENFDSLYNSNLKHFFIDGQNIINFTNSIINKDVVLTAYNKIYTNIYNGFIYIANILFNIYNYVAPIYDKYLSKIYKFILYYIIDDKFDIFIVSFIATIYFTLIIINFIDGLHKMHKKNEESIEKIQLNIQSLQNNQKQIQIKIKKIIENNIYLADLLDTHICQNEDKIKAFERKLRKIDKINKLYQ